MRRVVNADKATLSAFARRAFSVALLVLVSVLTASAQITTPSDGQTPLGLQPGAPAGSYALSGFDNINLFNGNLNFRMPLLHIGGRGSAQMTVTLPIELKWQVYHSFFPGFPPNIPPSEQFFPVPGGWSPLRPGYGPGVLFGRRASKRKDCGFPVGSVPGYTLTRLTFITPDGTEYELRDQLTQGKPADIFAESCQGFIPDYYRGPIFVSADGSAMTFISDETSPITDGSGDGAEIIYPSGFLMLRDGSRLRIDEGLVTWIRDRNGNRLDFTYDEYKQVVKIADSLNRTVTFTYWDPQQGVWNDEITFKGFGGATRKIRVWYAYLHDALRSGAAQGSTGYTLKRMNELFPELNGSSSDYNDAYVISSVELPDARHYRFFYNSYSELARVELPTGGAYEYDYTPTSGAFLHPAPGSGGAFEWSIFRRVIERRVYADGQTLEHRTTYTATEANGETQVDVRHLDSAGTLLARDKHYFYSTPTASFGREAIAYSAWQDGKEYLSEAYDTNGTMLRQAESTFEQRAAVPWWSTWPEPGGGGANTEPPNDVRLVEAVSTLKDAVPNQVTKQQFGYDQYNNRTDVWEYDFGQGGPPLFPTRHSHTDYLSTNPVNGLNYATNTDIHIRSLPSKQFVYAVNPANGQETEASRAEFEYDKYDGTAGHASLTDCPNVSGHDSAFTVGYQPRGNLTSTRIWLNTSSNWISIFQQYDMAGNIVKTINARGYATTFDYADRFGFPDGEARSNSSPQELFTAGKFSYAFPTLITNALLHTAYNQYEYYLGAPVEGEDANGIIANARYDDLLGRPTQVDAAVGTSLQRRTSFLYNDPARTITTRGDQNSYLDGLLKGEMIYDGLGREVETRQYETVSTYIKAIQSYDALGRGSRAYNPHRATSEQTYGWTDPTYDALSRVKRVESFDKNGVSTGAVVTVFSGNATTVTEQAGKVRRSVADGLGRLIRVDEPDASGNLGSISAPVQPTNYSYDALDNLTQVNQGGQIRQFIYDSLSRLRETYNVEQVDGSGVKKATIYSYDNASNPLSRTNPNLTTVTLTYDPLNRVQTKTLSTGGVWTYSYDTGTNGKGRMVSVTKGAEGYFYDGYDALGRLTASHQVTNAVGTDQTYTMSYGYDLAGNLTSQVYPSGKEYKTSFDSAGRISDVKRYINQTFDKTYASQFQYTPHGGIASITLGNTDVETMLYNSRLQPTKIELKKGAEVLLGLDYTYGTSTNNGNVMTQTIRIGATTTISQSYGYDSLNRLTSAQESVSATTRWTQTYGYDRFGNRTSLVNTGSEGALLPTQSTPGIDVATNRLEGFGYDTSGNVKTDATGNTYDYDSENHQTSFNNGAAVYAYDGDGQRVKKIVGTTTTVFVYNAAGQLVAEYSSAQAQGSGTSYLTSDHLGSTRVVTGMDGNVKARHDYLPFGEELRANIGSRTTAMKYDAADSTRQRFTGYERDTESGLDFAQARYCASAHGRFTSVDPLMASARTIEPQSWNRYSYTINNPLKYVDPDGLDWWYKTGSTVYTPEWFDRDPGPDYERWTSKFTYVYQITTGPNAGRWVTLDPTGPHAFLTDTQERARDKFYEWANGGVISGTAADRDFWVGFIDGLAPLGFERIGEPDGVDTTSRDYKAGIIAAIIVSGGIGITKSKIARITTGIPAQEARAIQETLAHINAGTKPVGPLAKKWGTPFENRAGDLPGVAGAGGYKEYRVAPPSGVTGAGKRRIVVSDTDGAVYYTWTHYGDAGKPEFVRIK